MDITVCKLFSADFYDGVKFVIELMKNLNQNFGDPD